MGSARRSSAPSEIGPTSLTAAGPLSVAVADLNADAVPDLVTSTLANGLAVWLGQGEGTFGPRADLMTGNTPVSLMVGDLNG